MDKAHIIMGFHWIIYCVIHSILANNYIKKQAQHYLKMGSPAYRVFYNLFAFVYLLLLAWLHLRKKSPLLFHTTVTSDIIAILLVLAGLGIMFRCVAKYFRQLSGLTTLPAQPELYTGGLHRYVRHPLYLGTFIFLAGLCLYWPFLKNLLVTIIIISYTLVGILLEEKKLIKLFGSAYRDYQHKVPMLIPGLRMGGRKTNSGSRSLIN